MAIEQNNVEERQARLDAMIAEFRAAQQRSLVKAGKALWSRTEQQLAASVTELPPTLN